MKMIEMNGLKMIDDICRGEGRLKTSICRIFIIFSIIFISSNPIAVFAVTVKLLDSIEISTGSVLPQGPEAFCVTEDELFIIPDFMAGNIKIYERKGDFLNLVKVIGRKGYGPGELAQPRFCFYNEDESKFGVLDIGRRKIFIYDRVGRKEFKQVKDIPCWNGGDDIQLIGNRLFISGYKPNLSGSHYDFYSIDLRSDKTTFLLPSYYKYGFKFSRDFGKQYNNEHIPAIGIRGWFDIYRDDAYFVWEGNLKIIKLNIESGDIEPISFGKKPPYYIKPYASLELLEARNKRDIERIENEKAKMSYVRHIFTSSKYVFIIYQGPVQQGNGSNFRMQFYALDGDFINEAPIPGQPDRRMWFDKKKHILYSLVIKPGEGDENYFILKYKIFE